ncbi:MAG: penicillin acylase family protein [Bacteroidetes bacterium]|nr:penicillin acylase family protein [Bacteroidota bacterium]
MKRFKLVLAIVSLILIIVLVSVVLFLRRIGTGSLPEQEGALAVPGVGAETKILRDSLGVPYIEARSDSDAYFALGFVHAQDRLFQMEMYRRLGEGRLSEVFGKKTLPIDELFRTLRFTEMADSLYDHSSMTTKKILRWYSSGVNAYLSSTRMLPAEFSMLKIQPDPWTPRDCLIIARLMSWELNISWWTKPVFGELYDKLGPAKAAFLIPLFSGSSSGKISGTYHRTVSSFADAFIGVNSKAMKFIDGVGSPDCYGSNNWTIAPSKTNNGSAILCNDPHLAFSEPAKWYFVSINSPSLQVMGVTLPGTPGIVIGRDRNIAWGMTNVMGDDSDFYTMVPDSSDSSMYWYDGKLLSFQTTQDTIEIKGSSPYVFTRRMTVQGPVVSDVLSKSYGLSPLKAAHIEQRGVVALRWAAYWPSDETKSIFLLNTARDFDEFVNALKYFGSPAQNFVYADVKGNIGYKAAGNLPLRNYSMPFLPQSGNSSKYVWQSFIPFDALPESYNPSSEFLATANNRTTPANYPYYVTNLYEPSSRINRINSFISTHDTMSVELCRELQLDYYSDYMKVLNDRLVAACDSENYSPKELVYLANFNGIVGEKSTAAAILNVTFVQLVKNLFEPVLGSSLFRRYVVISNVPTRILGGMLKDPGEAARLYDVANGDSLMNVKLVESLKESLEMLRAKFGPRPINWMWGRLHELELKHPLSANPLLRRLYDLGPFERGGNNTTVNNGEYSLNKPFDMLIGPSMRMIVDMGKEGMYFSLPGGECGQLLSPHYSDFLPDYLQGREEFFPMQLSAKKAAHELKLTPEE